MTIFKFANHPEVPPLEYCRGGWQDVIYLKLERGDKLSRAEKDSLFDILAKNSLSRTCVCYHGWAWDFSTWLRRYWVKFYYGNGNVDIMEYYALDKTSIQHHFKGYSGKIAEIVEVSR